MNFTLAAKVQIESEASLCILKIRSIRDNTSKKYETVINGIDIGQKSFLGEIMEGKIVGEFLVVNKPKRPLCEEISIDGNMVVYVKMMNSQLSISEARNVFDLLPVKFGHNPSLLLPYHSSLSESSSIESSDGDNIKCKICEK